MIQIRKLSHFKKFWLPSCKFWMAKKDTDSDTMHCTALRGAGVCCWQNHGENRSSPAWPFLQQWTGRNWNSCEGVVLQQREGRRTSPCYKVCILCCQHGVPPSAWSRDKPVGIAGLNTECCQGSLRNHEWTEGRRGRHKPVVKCEGSTENRYLRNSFPEKQQQQYNVSKLSILSFKA